jgi:rhodanese-related sulfurtransferase
MIQLNNIYTITAVAATLLLSACGGSNSNEKNSGNEDIRPSYAEVSAAPAPEIRVGEETRLLLDELKERGDYVGSRDFPSLINASIVHEEMGGENYLVIDIRNAAEFREGHIAGAVNVGFRDLPAFFESGIKPFEYERIILVSSSGQDASYTTALLRLMGYGNVYAMRWGMSSWNKQQAEKGWYAGISSDYESELSTDITMAPEAMSMPDPNTGMLTGESIASARFGLLFADGLENVSIGADEVFADASQFYIINYERRDKYESGHIPGAVRYKPGAMLGIIEEMATIPAEKTIVVYCGTGHNSAFVTAYLRLFGYDARTLEFGNNGFMFNRMVNEKSTLSWHPFSSEDYYDFETVD